MTLAGWGDICTRPPGLAWSPWELAATFATWEGMLAAMMAPVLVPWLRALARRDNARLAWFAAGYAVAWSGFGLAATAAQWGLSSFGLLSAVWLMAHPWAFGAGLAVVGLYQWSPLKQACLKHCQSPASFFLARWRDGRTGALAMGAQHGLHCIGCCWGLMVLMLFAGLMTLPWMVGVGVFLLAEMYIPRLAWLPRAAGAGLVGLGVALPLLA